MRSTALDAAKTSAIDAAKEFHSSVLSIHHRIWYHWYVHYLVWMRMSYYAGTVQLDCFIDMEQILLTTAETP